MPHSILRTFVQEFVCTVFVLGAVFASGTAHCQSLEEVIQWESELTLEEPGGIFTVQPRVSLDPTGGFVVADMEEQQIRLYDEEGALTQAFGHKGQGPGAFELVTGAIRLSSGNVLAAEFSGSVSVLDSTGTHLRGFTVPVRIMDLQRLPDGSILLAGMSGAGDEQYLLHRLDLENQEVEGFFPLPVSMDRYSREAVSSLSEVVAADVRKDTIVASFALDPKLYFFNLQGERIGKREIELEHFTHADRFRGESASSFIEWATTFSFASDLFWLEDGSFLVQYAEYVNVRTGEKEFSLAHVSEDGHLNFDVPKAPQLFTIDCEEDEAYFVHPDSQTKERWAVGRLSTLSQ